MAKTLYAVDELSGFVTACALVRPTGIEGMKVKSVRKKLKQPSFAAKVDREQIATGIEELGVDEGEHIAVVIEALTENAEELGLTAAQVGDRREEMRRGLKIALTVVVVLIGLGIVNAFVLDNQTKQAEVTADGGKIEKASSVDLQVFDSPATGLRPGGRPDRASALLRLFVSVVEPDPPRAQREPSRHPHRPDRPRRLREAAGRVRDRQPGGRRRRGPELARRPGRDRGRATRSAAWWRRRWPRAPASSSTASS